MNIFKSIIEFGRWFYYYFQFIFMYYTQEAIDILLLRMQKDTEFQLKKVAKKYKKVTKKKEKVPKNG